MKAQQLEAIPEAPCFVRLTLARDGSVVWKNMTHITTITENEAGAVLWDHGASTTVLETPAQVIAMIREGR